MPRAKKPPKPNLMDLDMQAVEQMLERVRALVTPEDFGIISAVVQTVALLTDLLRSSKTTIARMRRLFGLTRSEKLAEVLPAQQAPADTQDNSSDAGQQPAPAQAPTKPAAAKRKGHGRVPASAYTAAPHIPVEHQALHVGDRCPDCHAGNLFQLKDPAPIVRIFGQAPLAAVCFDPERFRCSTCQRVFTAPLPEQAQGPKYDETAASMMALVHYSAGMAGNRLDHLQSNLQSPVSSSTQWHILNERVELLRPAYDELRRVAAQGQVLHNDDSYMRILQFVGKRRAALLAAADADHKLPDPERTGMFTTAIVSVVATIGIIALFSTGRKHAGENLDELLALRDAGLGPPIQMGDAATRNVPKTHPVLDSNCIAHGRRQVVDELANYPAECRFLLEHLATVFQLDKDLKALGVSDQVRLLAHRYESGPIMANLRRWMTAQLEEKRVEPNSGLGKAFNYFLKRWSKFTLFLRVPGAPLDNNLAERALKMAINYRKNSLFYLTQRGATVGDIFMSLIYTARLHDENAFDYLTELQRNYKAVADRPADWLPWNYRATLAAIKSAAPKARARPTPVAVAA